MAIDLFSPFDPINGTPVTIVFGTFNYRNVINKWINHALSTCDHWRIICLDQELVSWLNEMGYGTCAVYLYDLFPDMTQHNLNNLDKKSRAKVIFSLRKKLFYALAESGRDFIHSDADAFWLQDPRPWLGQHTEFDLLVSQGSFSPKSQVLRHRFTLCAGFFLCRANVRTKNYFRQVAEAKWYFDQKSMNEVLLNDPEAYWQIRQPSAWSSDIGKLGGEWRTIPMRSTKVRRSKINSLKGLRQLKSLLYYILISPEIIKGRFSNGLTVGIIPLHLVTRINYKWPTSPFVVHINANKRKQAVEGRVS